MKNLYASLAFEDHSDIVMQLGYELTETGHIKVDTFQMTSIDRVFSCGDNSSPMRPIASTVYTGNLSGAMINYHLVQDIF